MIEEGQHGTPARLNVSQAAKAVRRARSTLNRDIDNGKVSVTRNGKGQPFIDIAELERVYGSVDIRTVTENVSIGQDETFKNGNSDSSLSGEIEVLRERLSTIEIERERERQQLTDQIEDLRNRLNAESEERRKLTAILTDQRTQQQLEPAPAAQPRKGFRSWLHRITA
jgi:predicted RNase H-like nuclease (RuvC/YqgF family)